MRVHIHIVLGIVLLSVFSFATRGHDCVLKVGVRETFPKIAVDDSSGDLGRNAAGRGFISTAKNVKTERVYKGVPLLGYLYFENLPEGDYQITVRKPGFITTIQSHKFSCTYASDGFDFVAIEVHPGNSNRPVVIKEMRLDRLKEVGSSDSGSNTDRIEQPIVRAAKTMSGGVLNSKASSLPMPPYPPAARAAQISGAVSVLVIVDEEGKVTFAKATSGHALLVPASEAAARVARFPPALLDGFPVRVTGIIIYKFVP